MYRSDRANDVVMDRLRESLARRQARGVACYSEIWLASAPAGQPLAVMPKDHPERREAVAVWVEHYDVDGGALRLWQADISRDAAGAPTLGPWELLSLSRVEGRMAHFLPPRGGDA